MEVKERKDPLSFIANKTSLDVRMSLIEQSNYTITETVNRIESQIDRLDSKIERKLEDLEKYHSSEFEYINKKLDKADARIWSNFYWILTTMFSLACAVAAILSKGFHWI